MIMSEKIVEVKLGGKEFGSKLVLGFFRKPVRCDVHYRTVRFW